ncbi:zona pellucida sperm-binding protein 3b [Misgurnus anguillicaudatus]|uniref:zona pellucida sperm-binding protein 3b n=1 Tax=Misgurnus anguillicaudatus TaxID=75329 RepID=UPI003CCF49A2
MWLSERIKLCFAVILMTSLLAECYPRMNPRAFQQGMKQQLWKSQFQAAIPPKINDPVPQRRQKTIDVRCKQESMEIVMHADLFATGLPVYAEELWLGPDSIMNKVSGGSCGAVQSGELEFTVVSNYKDCGTTLSITNEFVIYSNVLVYSPLPSPDGVLHQYGAVIPIQCQFQRQYNVDSAAVAPTWIPYAAAVSAADFLDFSLRLMSDDWQHERGSNVYFLGDPIHLQASVTLANHLPLLLFVDHCVATPTPNVDESELQYSFIDYNGCLSDSMHSSSRSKFLQRTEGNKLNLLLDAFRFYRVTSNLIFITCYLKAIPAAYSVSSQNRACSFIDKRWQSVDGNDQVCNSCEPSKRGMADPEPIRPSPITLAPPLAKKPGPAFFHSVQPGQSQKRFTPSPIKPTPPLMQPIAPQKAGPAFFFNVRPGQSLEALKALTQSRQYTNGSLSKRGTDSNKDWHKITTLGPLVVLPKQETSQLSGSLQISPSEDSTTSVTEKPELLSPVTDTLEVTQGTKSLRSGKALFLNFSDILGSEEGSGFE